MGLSSGLAPSDRIQARVQAMRASRASVDSFVGGGGPKVHFPMRALEPQQRLGRELRYQRLRVDLALRSRRRRLGRVAFDEALQGVDARRLAQVLEHGLEADGDVVDGVAGHPSPGPGLPRCFRRLALDGLRGCALPCALRCTG